MSEQNTKMWSGRFREPLDKWGYASRFSLSCERYSSVKVMVVACDKLPELAVTVIV
jgi:hypothetical protein